MMMQGGGGSGGVFGGSGNQVSTARSNATYSPRIRLGYGTLFCLAENSIGVQRDPCTFTIVEAGKFLRE